MEFSKLECSYRTRTARTKRSDAAAALLYVGSVADWLANRRRHRRSKTMHQLIAGTAPIIPLSVDALLKEHSLPKPPEECTNGI